MKSFDDMHFVHVVSTPRLCKALEELYKMALPETQGIK